MKHSENQILNQNEVISVGENDRRQAVKLVTGTTFRLDELQAALKNNGMSEKLISEGIDCQILSPGQDWRKGKFRLAVVFEPDESAIESPLDDIRQSIAQPD